MSQRPCVPRSVVDDPDDQRRNALESQLLSLLSGFQACIGYRRGSSARC